MPSRSRASTSARGAPDRGRPPGRRRARRVRVAAGGRGPAGQRGSRGDPADRELLVDPPDALVLVAGLRRPQGLTAVRRVHRLAPGTRIVVVAATTIPTSLQARQALNAGADAFVAHSAAPDRSPSRARGDRGLVCAPRQARRVLAKPTFSHREKEVLSLLVAGLTNREIASRLFLAESTVKSHLGRSSRSSASGPARMPSRCCSTRTRAWRLSRCRVQRRSRSRATSAQANSRAANGGPSGRYRLARRRGS